MTTDYLSLITKHTQGEHPQTVPAFIIHSALVTKKALDIAQNYNTRHPDVNIDRRLLEEMGMLHDIGIFSTENPDLHTTGQGEYITHIDRGAEILIAEGAAHLAGACRTHTGITREQAITRSLPLADENHMPETMEEEILCLADFFYSKRFDSLFYERSAEEVREHLRPYGQAAVQVFDDLAAKYL